MVQHSGKSCSAELTDSVASQQPEECGTGAELAGRRRRKGIVKQVGLPPVHRLQKDTGIQIATRNQICHLDGCGEVSCVSQRTVF